MHHLEKTSQFDEEQAARASGKQIPLHPSPCPSYAKEENGIDFCFRDFHKTVKEWRAMEKQGSLTLDFISFVLSDQFPKFGFGYFWYEMSLKNKSSLKQKRGNCWDFGVHWRVTNIKHTFFTEYSAFMWLGG